MADMGRSSKFKPMGWMAAVRAPETAAGSRPRWSFSGLSLLGQSGRSNRMVYRTATAGQPSFGSSAETAELQQQPFSADAAKRCTGSVRGGILPRRLAELGCVEDRADEPCIRADRGHMPAYAVRDALRMHRSPPRHARGHCDV